MSNCEIRINQILSGFRECQDILVAIGDETRILVLVTLLQGGLKGMRVGEISEKIHLTRPSVSHHLKVLKETGIVKVRKEKTMNFYYMGTDEKQWKKMLDLFN